MVLSRRKLIIGAGAGLGAGLAYSLLPARGSLRLAIVADPHHSIADRGSKACSHALRLLDEFAKATHSHAAHAALCVGDLIEEVDRQTDQRLAADLKRSFAKARGGVQCVPGNHDMVTMNVAAWEEVLGRPTSFTSRSYDVGGFHLVLFCAIRSIGPYEFTRDELGWLRADLARSQLPAIIFTHVPILAGDLTGNGYFTAQDGHGEWRNAQAAREIIRTSSTVLVVQGHTHQNAWTSDDGVHYLTVPSLTESRRTGGSPSGSFALIDIDQSAVAADIVGLDPSRRSDRTRHRGNTI